MTPMFSIWISAFAAAGRAARTAGVRLAQWGAHFVHGLRERRRAKVKVVGDEYLHEYTGLTRADLDWAFRDPVWSRRSAGLDRPMTAHERRLSEKAVYYPL